jgi:hypothetical protein
MATRNQRVKPSVDTAVEPARGKGPVKGKTPPRLKALKGRKAKPRVDAKREYARSAAPVVEAGGWPELGEQQTTRRAASRTADGYLRLQVHVENGQMSIVESHRVDGPLAQTPMFEGRYAYEVSDSGRLLHAGSIPDVGTIRGFAHPNGTLEQRGHHTYELASYDFHARVPLSAVTRSALSKVAVVLYRVKEHAPSRAPLARAVSAEPLGTQRERELREVGRVVGLPAWILESGARKTTARSGSRTQSAPAAPARVKKTRT